MIRTGKTLNTRRKTCPGAILFTTNPTLTSPTSNLAFGSERMANNSINQGKMLKTKMTLDFRINFIHHTEHIMLPL